MADERRSDLHAWSGMSKRNQLAGKMLTYRNSRTLWLSG
jgi:hypothetical protein